VARNVDATPPAGSTAVERAPHLRVHLFGHVRVFTDGAPFRMATPRKALPLLAYLLLHRDVAVSRDFLSFLLWPDEAEESARTKLRATLHDLVRVMPPAPDGHWIASEGTTICWNPGAPVSLDVDDFEAAIADPERLEEAVELYAGDLLEALYDEWIIGPRERLRSAYIGALGHVVSRARRRLDFPRAIACARRLLEADSLSEDVARRLIALRYEAGDRAGALEEYDRFERRVRDELGIDPMPETTALREAILRNDAVGPSDLAAAEPTPTAPVRAMLPFVGRRDEMQQLLDGWSRADRGRGGLAFIGGDPGIGKSRLVAEFAREVDERGGRVLIGATGSPETMPYQAIVEALRSVLPLVASLRLEGIWLSSLATLLPELSTRIEGLPALPQIEPENERARLFGALARALAALARPRPLLLVLEDLHWAEEATIAALSFLARRLALSPIFVVATSRDDEAPRRHPLRRARHDTTNASIAHSLSLRPLSLADVEQLTKSLAETPAGSPSALLAASEGNPLLLGQLLEEPQDGVRFEGPSSIGAIIAARVDRLSPEARSVAEIAALVGQRFSREVVRDVGGWDESTFTDALDELLDRRIVREATGRGAFDYAFAHQIVCDVVARAAPPQRSAARHRRIARTLEELHPERASEFAAELGRHYELAGEAEAAAARYLTAARRALSLAALEEARTHLERALPLAADQRLRADLLIERDRVSRRTGDHATRAAALEELSVLAEVMNDDEYRRTVALLHVQFAAATDDETAHRAALERLRAVAFDGGARWRTAFFLEEASALSLHGDLEGLEAAGNAALAAARESQDDAGLAGALVRLADASSYRARFAEAQALLDQAQAAAARAHDGAVEMEALRAAFQLAYDVDDAARCLAIAERWLERATALGDRYAESYARSRLGLSLFVARRDFARVRAELSRAIEISEELGSQMGTARTLMNRALLETELGDFADAGADTERALEIFEAIDDIRGKSLALSNIGLIRSLAGDPQRGRVDATAGYELAHSTEFRVLEACALENIAIAAAFCGDTAEAIRLGGAALALHEEAQSNKWSGRLRGDLALWHAARGDLDAARKQIEEMLALKMPAATEWPQSCPWAAAQVLRHCGEDARARSELARARRLVAEVSGQLDGDELARYESIPWNRAIIAAHDRDEWPVLEQAPTT
jgi:DNA-binding SARP family transcriptional activator